MTSSTSVLLAVEAGIATLTLKRPEVLNAFDAEMAEAFLARIEEIAARDDVRVILLKGEGRGFCAGGDVSQFTKGGDPQAAIKAIIDPLHEGLRRLDGLTQPSVACLHSAVAGAGFSLALACDLAVAAENAKFTLAYARIGATPDGSGTYHLPRIVGMKKAKELALLADTIDAGEALRLGLVNRVVPPDMLPAAATELARRLANGPTQAYGRVKGLLGSAGDRTLAEQLDAERGAFMASAATAGFSEGVAAFLDKRPPRFTGR
ncbi:enoyl-CoA hydratase [Bosea caraganae]|uniref:Enoyl-CoA hydratase n=1 Tax=Bosea caraganae TaxID=2763117 RepID=A0A370L5Z2_9HYPH|nr:enoyl-CoA hydratase-related protein [Bosea caraganae]RDJ23185.1 enoyl-CoA hydratase [Bosea caraganae]RDJ24702.1 enoyl-CoA hydratase [Bosea caraganae]